MPSLTVENYLKAALQIGHKTGSSWVTTGQLADWLDVSPGTVTSMLKTLDEAKLAEYKPYEGVCLTEQGRKLALRMLRRHRLIELFLVRTLDLSWDQVHTEAEHMEHAVSDSLIDHIDEFLGHPETDPHGDPIPTADGKMRGDSANVEPLSACHPPMQVELVRVTNQNADFLRYLSNSGLGIGTVGTVSENNAEAGIVTIEIADRAVSLGQSAAEQLLVRPVHDPPPRKF